MQQRTPKRPKRIFDRRSIFFSIVILGMFAVIVYLLYNLTDAVRRPAGSADTDAALYRNVGNKLKSEKLYEQAVTAYEHYLTQPGLDADTRANIHYLIGNLQFELHNYEQALAAYYAADLIGVPDQIRQDLNIKLINALERLGRDFSAEYALKSRTTLDQDNARPEPTGTVVARYADQVITMRDLDEQLERLPEEQRKQYRNPEKKFMFLQQYIGQKLLARKAKKMGYERDTDIQKQLDAIKEQLMIEKMAQAQIKDKITLDPEDIRNYYTANQWRYTDPAAVRIAYIPASSQEDAEALRSRIEQGEQFEQIAQQAGVQNGGLVDAWLSVKSPIHQDTDYSAIVRAGLKENEEAVFVAPFNDQYAVVQLLGKQPQQQLPFEEVAQQVSQDYQVQKAQKIYQDMMQDLLKVEDVTINNDVFFPDQKQQQEPQMDIKRLDTAQ